MVSFIVRKFGLENDLDRISRRESSYIIIVWSPLMVVFIVCFCTGECNG